MPVMDRATRWALVLIVVLGVLFMYSLAQPGAWDGYSYDARPVPGAGGE